MLQILLRGEVLHLFYKLMIFSYYFIYILILEDLNFPVILQLLFCVLPKNY